MKHKPTFLHVHIDINTEEGSKYKSGGIVFKFDEAMLDVIPVGLASHGEAIARELSSSIDSIIHGTGKSIEDIALDDIADEIIDRHKGMVHTFCGENLEDLSYRQLLAAAMEAYAMDAYEDRFRYFRDTLDEQ